MRIPIKKVKIPIRVIMPMLEVVSANPAPSFITALNASVSMVRGKSLMMKMAQTGKL